MIFMYDVSVEQLNKIYHRSGKPMDFWDLRFKKLVFVGFPVIGFRHIESSKRLPDWSVVL